MKINLTAKTPEQGRILDYLENNVSEILADKINNGVTIEKDGKTLINKKDLDGFISFAYGEAQKLIVNNETTLCVDGDTICGWAVHYFEEDDIIGKLYNGDGTEYEPPKPKTKPAAAPTTKVVPPKPASKPQISMFDLINSENTETEEKADSNDDTTEAILETDDTEEVPTVSKVLEEESTSNEDIMPPIKEKPQGSLLYQNYMAVQRQYPDCIIVYRLGDFYEVFGKNAVTLAEELNLTLTGRDCGLDSRVPMIGFPYHAADAYIAKIVPKHKVAIAENATNVREFTTQTEDEDDDVEEVPYEEMKAFDGDINEPTGIPDISSEPVETVSAETETDDFMKCFDSEAVAKIYELLGDKLDLQ